MYVQTCNSLADQWAAEFPDRFHIVDSVQLDDESAQRELLSWLGYMPAEVSVRAGLWRERKPPVMSRQRTVAHNPDVDPLDPRRCAILVPVGGQIMADCDDSLRELERRGYTVETRPAGVQRTVRSPVDSVFSADGPSDRRRNVVFGGRLCLL